MTNEHPFGLSRIPPRSIKGKTVRVFCMKPFSLYMTYAANQYFDA